MGVRDVHIIFHYIKKSDYSGPTMRKLDALLAEDIYGVFTQIN